MARDKKSQSGSGARSAASGGPFKLFDTGVGTDLGTKPPPSTSWTPKIVQYYRLGFSCVSNKLEFRFTHGCGFRALTAATDFDDFIAEAKVGLPTVTNFKVVEPGPHFTVFAPGYVMIALEPYNWRFLKDHAAITIGANHAPKGVQAAYFSLTHIDTLGNSFPQQAPSKEFTSQLMYFGVDPRIKSTPSSDNDSDRFNLYVEVDLGGGDTIPLVLDPDIKNDGGTDPQVIGAAS